MHLRQPPNLAHLLACGLACGLIGTAASAAPPAAVPAEPKACEGIGDPSFFRDEGINIKVSTRLRFNKALMRENIQTKTNGGIVTLHGYVSTAEHSRLAAKRAAEVGGVRCVSNFIVVGPPPPQPAGNPY
ncbi:MAG TPA: BON domain-containing protein [Rhodocyclaceae bacterium]|nr:BON domain-containing protein [Rhodocyclaceae bacterium]HMV52502.1 BON domain-containing protein [Rhodocyclaceae bacterium]HMZ84754.1 BON domain-containing protein [Rhodocyclaceae bacterium]HNA03284.1 BON domain-containing protein [Rhodocyclaceae bacterium]HNB78751.1 BON domain-containing protein [Rhodocyclaceae bacterium]